jgi:hypothetical protein
MLHIEKQRSRALDHGRDCAFTMRIGDPELAAGRYGHGVGVLMMLQNPTTVRARLH